VSLGEQLPEQPVAVGPRRLTVHLRWWWVLAVLLAAGLVFMIVVDRLLVGGVLVASGFFLAGILRLVVPESSVGGLHVRTRVTDVVMYLGAGAVVLVADVLVLLRYSA
jgi:DUF3017 family protein